MYIVVSYCIFCRDRVSVYVFSASLFLNSTLVFTLRPSLGLSVRSISLSFTRTTHPAFKMHWISLPVFLALTQTATAAALPQVFQPATCSTCTPSPTTCDFYTCLESNYSCGPSGYPIGYGYKFCSKFGESYYSFSPKGQVWVNNVRQCLQESLIDDMSCNSSCSKIQSDAFGSHAGCYVRTGVCELPPSDWFEILHTVGLKTLLGSSPAILQALQTAEGCADLYAHILEEII
jgi:hypothetical protein